MRIFKRQEAITGAVERAVTAQREFEAVHPVTFDSDQRKAALLGRAALFFGARLPASGVELVETAAKNWMGP